MQQEHSSQPLKAIFVTECFDPAQTEILRINGFTSIPFTLKQPNTDSGVNCMQGIRYIRGDTHIDVVTDAEPALVICANTSPNVVVMTIPQSHPSYFDVQKALTKCVDGVVLLELDEPMAKTVLTMTGGPHVPAPAGGRPKNFRAATV